MENDGLNVRLKYEGEDEMVANDQFIQIWGFMRKHLGLEKTELLVYAVIFSMHRAYGGCFVGSRKYLEEWTGAAKTAIQTALASLEDKNLIIKEYRSYGNWRKAVYYVNVTAMPRCCAFEVENRQADIIAAIQKKNRLERVGGSAE